MVGTPQLGRIVGTPWVGRHSWDATVGTHSLDATVGTHSWDAVGLQPLAVTRSHSRSLAATHVHSHSWDAVGSLSRSSAQVLLTCTSVADVHKCC
eukprot:357900-Chlamydomonas_euryale.AAC.1